MAIHEIKITKADQSIRIDDADLSDETLLAVIREGLKVCLNAKMTKITGLKDAEGEALTKLHADAMEVANKNLSDLRSGNFKFPGAKAKKAESREVTNEAMRLARDIVRDLLRANGITISHVPAKDITTAAKNLVDTDETILAQARENIAKRSEVPEHRIDLSALGLNTTALKAESDKAKEAASAKRKESLSAAQAGRTKSRTVAPKAKPKADAGAVLAAVGKGHTAPTHGAVH